MKHCCGSRFALYTKSTTSGFWQLSFILIVFNLQELQTAKTACLSTTVFFVLVAWWHNGKLLDL